MYKRRNPITMTFDKLKRYRRLATRHDSKVLYFCPFLYLAASPSCM